MGLIIAGDRSGVGKTTITLALLASLREKGRSVQSFKVGPDYIDPMFHSYITGRSCRNLDPVLTSTDYVKSCYSKHCQNVEYSVIEGVMGLFDGLPYNPKSDYPFFSSTAHVARLLELPVILVLDCSRMSSSVAAIAHGFQTFDPHLNLAGVVLNRVASARHQEHLEAALESLNLPIIGRFRRESEIAIPDRHLGLIPTDELPQLNHVLERLAHLGNLNFNWEKLNRLFIETKKPSPPTNLCHQTQEKQQIKLAIAQDRAFNFYYADNLDSLQQWGVELIPWSPLNDRELPTAIDGLYFGGGFPEVFAQQLSENHLGRKAVKQAILNGTPTYAECGGLMYLCQNLTNFEGQTFDMVGIIPSSAIMEKKLTLGYRQATVLNSSPIAHVGDKLYGHEFHRSQLTPAVSPETKGSEHYPLFELTRYDRKTAPVLEGWQTHNIHASYLHLHWGDLPELPQRFVQQMSIFANQIRLHG